jgi:hypothetical protein
MSACLGRLVLVLALLAGWQAALLHPLEHVDDHGHLVHVVDQHSHDDGDSSDPSSKLCDAFAALTACAPDGAIVFLGCSPASQKASFVFESAPRAAEAPPFLAQAPPTFL